MMTASLDSAPDGIAAYPRRGDLPAFRAIIKTHNRRLYRIARSILRDDAEAEDAVQEAYLKAFTHICDFRADSTIGTWLCRIVMNESLGRLRRRRPSVDWTTIDDFAGRPTEKSRLASLAGLDPERATAHREIQRTLEGAIDKLPQDFRRVFLARDVEGMSIEETARLLEVPAATVKTRLFRARRQLRAVIEARFGMVLKEIFPFEDPRCRRIEEAVITQLKALSATEEPSQGRGI